MWRKESCAGAWNSWGRMQTAAQRDPVAVHLSGQVLVDAEASRTVAECHRARRALGGRRRLRASDPCGLALDDHGPATARRTRPKCARLLLAVGACSPIPERAWPSARRRRRSRSRAASAARAPRQRPSERRQRATLQRATPARGHISRRAAARARRSRAPPQPCFASWRARQVLSSEARQFRASGSLDESARAIARSFTSLPRRRVVLAARSRPCAASTTSASPRRIGAHSVLGSPRLADRPGSSARDRVRSR